ncbi:potassium voltage-gated channel subfamily G member 3 [Lethenteron reissneri]|uniref:potassium voltage-gated channel subfamily G member 3 n=1 Tax=Lethenteron reissneri TaxID=7753 RepID=UPI002AB6F794|nr:potassium voltage-gated channel subfamily G member 3 [Lethenteron reissneri]XP_061415009.1 potassium voltage-gated channel subfamily G member 3 [Lethenteron reissneri]
MTKGKSVRGHLGAGAGLHLLSRGLLQAAVVSSLSPGELLALSGVSTDHRDLVINVGGARYSLGREALRDFPLGRVRRLRDCVSEAEVLELCDDWDRDSNEYFFDRHADSFRAAVGYARHGRRLRLLPHMCELSFRGELAYWGLDGHACLEPCCVKRLDERMAECAFGAAAADAERREAAEAAAAAALSPTPPWLERMRRTFEEPGSSVPAHILAAVSVLFVLVSVGLLCASTLPEWKASERTGSAHDNSRIIEAVCMGWFTAECIVRFLIARDRLRFFRQPLNAIDVLAISPYYVAVALASAGADTPQLQRAGVTLRVLRMLRIFWLLKLARHSVGLQTLGLTLRRCYREMGMLLMFVAVAMAIFAALAQLLEAGLDVDGHTSDFASIPASCWWVIISMTTVGYGDMFPMTVPGRVLGGACVVSGIVLLALPITFIYHSFVQCYGELRLRATRSGRIPPSPLFMDTDG